MSWFVVWLSKGTDLGEAEIRRREGRMRENVGRSPGLTLANPRMILMGGGLPETFSAKSYDSHGVSQGWVVCGIGIRHDADSFSILGEDDWERLFRNESYLDEISKINGHYAILTWNGNHINVIADALELRKVYIADTPDSVFVSTRLDSIVSMLDNPHLDVKELASFWTLVNSMSDNCFVKGVTRLGPSGHVSIKDGKIQHSWHHWLPKKSQQGSVTTMLEKLTALPIAEGHKLTLGLSGGIDSRTLLALLAHSPEGSWCVHSCGDKDNLDILVAKELARKIRVHHYVEYYEIQRTDTVDSVVNSLKDYVLRTEMSDSPFGYQKLRLFSDLQSRGYWMVDGGYGELLRRSYAKKLYAGGKQAIINRDASRLIDYFMFPKSKIFTADIQQLFIRESGDQLQKSIEAMPEEPGEDIGNWLDLFHIRYRLKNFPGNSQAVYDGHIASYMPYAQDAILSLFLTLDSNQRTNNKLNRKTVEKNFSELRGIPLVKSGTVVPYWTSRNAFVTKVWAKVHSKIAHRQINHDLPFRSEALLFIKEFVLDRIRSNDVANCSYYNYVELSKRAVNFYETPNNSDARFIEDWLMFDFWREKFDSCS
jgi:hypothetical protein